MWSMTEGIDIQELLCRTGNVGIHHKVIFSALNIPLCITAFLGNLLIIVALQKASFLHPPSKLLLGCLASTYLCRPTLGPQLALTRPNSPLEIMCKFPYLALTRLNSHYLAQTRLLSPLPSGHQFQWARSA